MQWGAILQSLFERLTDEAREVMVEAEREARELRRNYCGTEHVLLGLLREQDGLAARILNSFGIKLEEVRARVVEIIGQGDEAPSGPVPITADAERMLEAALREALRFGVHAIGTEHILLAMASEDDSIPMRILTQYYADSATIRNEVTRRFSGPDPARALSDGGNREHRSPPVGFEPGPVIEHEVRVDSSADVRRLMQSAAARALDDGRSQIALSDLLLALTREPASATLLAELGVDEASLQRVLQRYRRASD